MVARTSAKTSQNIKQCNGFGLETLGRMDGSLCQGGPLTSGEGTGDHLG